MTIYISGPMTGMPELNHPAFNAAATALRAQGFDVVNPAELCTHDMPWTDCMRRDIVALMDCDSIAMLPGWMDSRGARLERYIAVQLRMHIHDINELIPETTT